MSGISENLKLTTYNTTTDASSTLMYNFIDQTSGCSPTTNIGLIDAFAGRTSASLTEISGSLASVESKAARTKSAVIQIVNSSTTVDTSSGLFYLRMPTEFNGLKLERAIAFVNQAGTSSSSVSSGSTGVQVANITKYSGCPALSSMIVIADGDVIGSEGTIDTNYDDVSTNDQVKIYVTDTSGCPAQGLQVVLEYGF